MAETKIEMKTKERPIMFTAESVMAILDGTKTQTRRIVKRQPPSDAYQITTLMDTTARAERKRIGMHRWAIVEDLNIVEDHGEYFSCPYGKPGDRLYVKEAAYIDREVIPSVDCLRAFYADSDLCVFEDGRRGNVPFGPDPAELLDLNGSLRKVNPRFMPHWAARLTLEITGVRIQRLHQITEEDAKAEGLPVGQRATLPGEDSQRVACIHCGKQRNQHVGAVRACFGFSGEMFNTRTYKGGFAWLWDQVNGKRAAWASNPWVWVVEFKREVI